MILIGLLQDGRLVKTPVAHSWMYRQIVAGFLIWKMLSVLRIILSAQTAIRNVRNVLVASDTDAMCAGKTREKSNC